ncbi:MAG: right-handed parallel beta-helix repeat-containing protein [Armatimonadota bacterium]
MNRHRVLIWSLVLLAILCSSCFGQTVIRVSTGGNDSNDGSSWELAKKTVKAGIDAASTSGGEIWVAAGTYYEHISLKANCYLYGGFAGTESQRTERNFNINKSILDGANSCGIIYATGISTAACIDGFTIRNSECGICCVSSSSPKIANNIINGNGYGVYCDSSNPTITNNTIDGSSGSSVINGNARGINCVSSNPTITNNKIIGNNHGISCTSSNPAITSNTISGNGCGVFCASSSNPTITSNTINENSYSILCSSSSPTITNNAIGTNEYGIFCFSSNSTITNNTISGNGNYGIWYSGNLTIANNIVVFNGTGIYSTGENTTLKNNCVYGNTANYYGVAASSTDISKDPLLEIWRYGKLHIQPGSPCIDAGDSSVVDSSWVDMDGQPRIQGASVDIGADESDGTQWQVNSPIVVRVSTNGNDLSDGSSWALAKKTAQAGIDAAYANGGGEVWIAAGVYYEHITLKADIGIYGGFAGTESQRTERAFSANKCIFDSSGIGQAILVRGFSTTACIDGFTTRGSISCLSSTSPTISNNIISANLDGIFCDAYSTPIITNNTVTGSNSGIYCYLSSPAITNNIVAFNTTGIYRYSGSPTLKKNCVYGNTTDYSGLSAGPADISANPLFRDRDNGDYHLNSASPCINAGDDTAVQSGWVDMDGEARITGSHVDIGADEYSVFDVTGANAKTTKDTAYVLATNMVASSVYSGFYYVQDINRTYGIRVNQLKGTLPQVNQIISVNGVLGTTTDGERCLSSYETPSVTGQETAKPLMITCKYIGGGDYSYDSAAKTGQKGVKGSFGLNNIGLLVTVCGTVADIDTTNKKLYINDGSGSVAVYYGTITLPSDVVKGALVKATGACSCYRLDNENLSPLILLKDSSSIAALSTP